MTALVTLTVLFFSIVMNLKTLTEMKSCREPWSPHSDTSFGTTNEAAYLGGPGAASAMTQGITDVVEYMNRSTGFWQHIFPGVTVARMVGRVNARRKRELVPYMKQANQHWHFVKCEPSMIPESPTMEIGCRVLTTWNPMRLMRGALTGYFLHV